MSTFGKYAIVDGTVHHFDQEPEWWWKIKPVTSGMELEMSKFLAHHRVIQARGERYELPPTNLEIAFREIALCFGGTNIPKDPDKKVEEGGEPYLEVGAETEAIEAALRCMPREMFMEIWKAVGEAYPYWGPADPNSL
jgi:hypothetical protein